MKIRLLSLNCYLPPWASNHKSRLGQLTKELSALDADLIFLQEVFFVSDAKYLTEQLRTKNYSYSSRTKELLLLSKFPIKKNCFKKFNQQGDLLSWAVLDSLYGKGFQVSQVEIGGLTMACVNTHLLSAYGYDKGRYLATRRDQLKQIFSDPEIACASRLILAGDLNFDPNSSTYSLFSNYDVFDPLQGKSILSVSRHNPMRDRLFDRSLDKKLDYLLFRGFEETKITSRITLQSPSVSDHYGIWAEVEL